MKKELANEIIECLPKDRTLFRYYKDRYALLLLQYYIREGRKLTDVKNSRFAKLLNKEIVKTVISNCGDKILAPEKIKIYEPLEIDNYVLTLDKWDGREIDWGQCSRKGWNLVLQLNFSKKHDEIYKNLVKPNSEQALNYICHPVYQQRNGEYFRETLAWSRIDVDFTHNECLIEEIQSDWAREVLLLLKCAKRYKKRNIKKCNFWGIEGKVEDVIRYCENIVLPYIKNWSETMMAATVEFINIELGIDKIFYHTDSYGYKIKNIKYTKPPISLYSKLPQQFCFEKTNQSPDMLLADTRYKRMHRKLKHATWYELTI